MMNPKVAPAFLLRSYAWAVWQANTTVSRNDYGGLVPIVPVAEEPELTQYSKPYIVYGYSTAGTNDGHFEGNGSMSFVVYSNSFNDITTLLNILSVAFGREDETARDVNAFTSTIPQFIGMRFGSIEIGFVEGGTPEETEGGRQSGLLNIKFTYFVDYDVKVSPVTQILPDGDSLVGWE